MSRTDLTRAVEAAFGADVGRVVRRPSPYATSHAVDDVDVHLADGRVVHLVLKDPADDALLPAARDTRPAFLRDPEREAMLYRQLLGDEEGPPRLIASGPPGHAWLLLEKVAGVELYQVGDVELWAAAARWIARFHARHVTTAARWRGCSPGLLVHDATYHGQWRRRAAQRRDLAPLLTAYDAATEVLEGLTPTVVHGEFNASNVLVHRRTAVRVAALDWESAAVAAPPVDLADLVTGWDADARDRLLEAYWSEAGPELGIDDVDRLRSLVAHARVVAAIRLLTWSPEWRPPPEHARDWLVEAQQAAAEAGA